MNLDFLKGNPALNDISPEKLQFLMDFASNNADTKDAKSMASTVMNAANNAKQNGMTFSNTETTLLIELLKQNMSEAERVKADKMLQMMQMLQKRKKYSLMTQARICKMHILVCEIFIMILSLLISLQY